jgi:EAL domain-containing protein (putative c-di-GMP-specific phosphodiesterase class I)/CheY-like chemotaxis protein
MSPEVIAALRFLIVDDEPLMVSLSRRVLQDLGATQIQTASNGAAALALLEAEPTQTDIILCDLNMPHMDGVELTRHLASIHFGGAIVYLSGEEDGLLRAAKQVAEAHRLSVLGTLQKPDIVQPLRSAIARYTPKAPQAFTPHGPHVTEQELAQALERHEILLHYQPQLHVRTKQPHAVEALARWNHPVHGLLAPWKFIPLAEQTGRIAELTNQVLLNAFRQMAAWRAKGVNLNMAVNVPMQCFEHLPFVDFLAKAAHDENIALDNLILEVTESQLMSSLARSLEVLARLRIKRVCLAIDDFGTGYSSMQQLQQLPVQELKLDRGFVTGATHDARTRAILETSIQLAKRLGLRTVAEGVETEEEFQLVAELGCDLAQGYYFSPPLAAADLEQWLQNHAQQNP